MSKSNNAGAIIAILGLVAVGVLAITSEPVTETPPEDIERLEAALEEAYEIADFEPPYPVIRITSRRSDFLERNALATAAITEDGLEVIYMDRSRIIRGTPLLPLMLHELAHLKTWREHGIDVPVHGRQFMVICQSFADRRTCEKEG